jgi:hypothetical protein
MLKNLVAFSLAASLAACGSSPQIEDVHGSTPDDAAVTDDGGHSSSTPTPFSSSTPTPFSSSTPQPVSSSTPTPVSTSTPSGPPDSGPTTSSSPPPQGSCHTAADCPPYNNCLGPISDESICIAVEGCTNNSQCDDGTICSTGSGPQPSGGGGGKGCRPPCQSAEDCNYWESCQSDGTCKALPCAQCPAYLSCTQGACAAKACESDSDCPGAYCVDQTCFATLGTCEAECG